MMGEAMNLTVEWVYKDDLETKAEAIAVYGDQPIPVIRVATLREWITNANAKYANGPLARQPLGSALIYRAILKDLLDQLSNEVAS